jgi:hypothetical protein
MDDEQTHDEPAHPLTRAHRFFQKAAPAIRDAQETLERHGGIDGVCETVVRTADELVQRVDHVVANATAIEGEVIERNASDTPIDTPVAQLVRRRRRVTYVQVAIVAAAATYGALKLQRRIRH